VAVALAAKAPEAVLPLQGELQGAIGSDPARGVEARGDSGDHDTISNNVGDRNTNVDF
jgi:hypothetical protein